jgi:hypothetical protein
MVKQSERQCVGWNLREGTGSITAQSWGTGPHQEQQTYESL